MKSAYLPKFLIRLIGNYRDDFQGNDNFLKKIMKVLEKAVFVDFDIEKEDCVFLVFQMFDFAEVFKNNEMLIVFEVDPPIVIENQNHISTPFQIMRVFSKKLQFSAVKAVALMI